MPRKAGEKKKGLFDHLNAIYLNQSVDYFDKLSLEDKKSYSTYMINRLISMNHNFVEVVNELQQYYGSIGPRESYLFYSQLLPKGKQWTPYIKGKESAYEDWLVRLVCDHYEIGSAEAEGYLALFLSTEIGRNRLRELLEMYGTPLKLVRKIL